MSAWKIILIVFIVVSAVAVTVYEAFICGHRTCGLRR